MLLKIGSSGPAIGALVRKLRRLGFALPEGAAFNSVVRRTVEAFQSANVDSSGTPLVVDGKVGPHTDWAIDAALRGLSPTDTHFDLPPLPDGGSATGRAALQVALDELSANRGEAGRNNDGPDVVRYLAPTGLSSPANWCAAFVSYCFRSALGRDSEFGYVAGAQAVHNRMKARGSTYVAALSNPPQPGDIIVWRRVDPNDPANTAWQGHIGLVHSFSDGNL